MTRWQQAGRMATLAALFAAANLMAQAPGQPAGEAPKPQGSAAWERKASEWAADLYAKSVEKDKDQIAKLRAMIKDKPHAPLAEELAKAHAERGFVLFQRTFAKFVDLDQPPSPEEAKVSVLAVSLARNEWEPLQLGVWALRELNDVSCTVSDLAQSGGEGKIEAAREIRVLYGHNMIFPIYDKKATPADGDIVVGEGRKKKVLKGLDEHPAALLDLKAVRVAKDTAQAIVLDIHVPAEAPAGVYKGEIALSASGKELCKAPLEVTVHPIQLDDGSKHFSLGCFTSKFRSSEELIQMAEHGFRKISWWTSGDTKINLKGKQIEADYKDYQDYLKRLDEAGFTGPHCVFLGASDPKIENRIFELLKRKTIQDGRNKENGKAFADADLSPPFGEYLCQALKQWHEQMKAVGHGDMVACILDEPDHEPRPQRPTFYNKVYAMVEKGAPEVPTYGVFYHAGDEDKLSHHHAVWCSNRPQKRIAEKCKQAGKSLWTYGFGVKYNVSPFGTRLGQGLIPWVFGANGSFFWANYWHKGETFDPMSVEDLSTVSLPTPHGPLASPALKGLREAVDDRRYLSTLEVLIEKGKSGSEEAQKEAQEALAFLDSFRQPLYEKLGVTGGRPNFEQNNEGKPGVGKLEIAGLDGAQAELSADEATWWPFCEFVRGECVKRIVRLQEKLK